MSLYVNWTITKTANGNNLFVQKQNWFYHLFNLSVMRSEEDERLQLPLEDGQVHGGFPSPVKWPLVHSRIAHMNIQIAESSISSFLDILSIY